MLDYVKELISYSNGHLTVEERSLLSVAYKNLTGSLRGSWRIITHVIDVEGPKATRSELNLMHKEKNGIECELIKVCEDILSLLAVTLIPVAHLGDETVFYYKMYATHPHPPFHNFYRL